MTILEFLLLRKLGVTIEGKIIPLVAPLASVRRVSGGGWTDVTENMGHMYTRTYRCWVSVLSVLSLFPSLKRTSIYFSALQGRVIQTLTRVETENSLALTDEVDEIARGVLEILRVRCCTHSIQSRITAFF